MDCVHCMVTAFLDHSPVLQSQKAERDIEKKGGKTMNTVIINHCLLMKQCKFHIVGSVFHPLALLQVTDGMAVTVSI